MSGGATPWRGLLGQAGFALGRLAGKARDAVGQAADADRWLIAATRAAVEGAATRYPLDPGAEWQPGAPLKLLFVGYSGTRNTGADVRVEEMIRQLRHLFGDRHLELSIVTIDPAKTRGYFRTARQVRLPDIFPRFLFDEVHAQHGVVACEGSMFKSKFANALSTLMAGALGVAAAEHKLAIGYGGEAGKMDPPLEALVRDTCRKAFIVARNEASVGVLARLGIHAEVGTDTAWTFEPAADDVGRRILTERGWDGVQPVLIACPINPFWWPVTADVRRAVEQKALGLHTEAHYKSVYFHASGREVSERQAAYLDAFAGALRRVARDRGAFVALVGMEELDRRACEGIRERLGPDTPVLVSDEHDMFALVSVLRQATALVSSRYHAIVTSMPAGVPSVGVTMDERIRNLMADRGQPELALEVDDPELATKLPELVARAFDERERIRAGIAGAVARNLEAMGRMGALVIDHVRARHPAFPFRDGLGSGGDPWDHLPSLPRAVRELLGDAGHGPAHAGREGLA